MHPTKLLLNISIAAFHFVTGFLSRSFGKLPAKFLIEFANNTIVQLRSNCCFAKASFLFEKLAVNCKALGHLWGRPTC